MNPSVKHLLHELGIAPKKSLGQNFCTDQKLSEKVLERLQIQLASEVWEIGPGMGFLTEALLPCARRLRLFEIDARFRKHLDKLVSKHSGVTIHWGDVLKIKLEEIHPQKHLLICGNLPYYCGSAIMREMVRLDPPADKIVFLLQKEVVDKACALPGDEDYGFLSVSIQLFARVLPGEIFSSSSFFPNPSIDSRLVELIPFALNSAQRIVRKSALDIASRVFSQRRKMSLPLLRKAFPPGESVDGKAKSWEARFDALGISHQIRAECLSPEEFLRLAED